MQSKIKSFFCIIFICFSFLSCEKNDPTFVSGKKFEYSQWQKENPLKGLCPFYSENQKVTKVPYSLEYFYVPLKSLRDDGTEYDFSYIDEKLEKIKSRGRQAIFRIYIDYPSHKIKDSEGNWVGEDEIPEFIKDTGTEIYNYSVTKTDVETGTEYTFQKKSIDYSNEKVHSLLLGLIQILGEKYNDDERVAFVPCGLIGHWGEWHTASYLKGKGMPNEKQQIELFNAFEKAFPDKKILARYPDSPGTIENENLGFHDDSLTKDTNDPFDSSKSHYFVQRLERANLTERWQKAVIGGEVYPQNQIAVLEDKYPSRTAKEEYPDLEQYYFDCIEWIHCSWLMFSKAFSSDLTEKQIKNGIKASINLGYDFSVTDAICAKDENLLGTRVTVKNFGIAPFYYKWIVKLALEQNGKIIESWNTNWDITSILPEEEITFHNEHEISVTENCRLLMKIENPLENGIPVKFSNKEQDKNIDGWITLFEF